MFTVGHEKSFCTFCRLPLVSSRWGLRLQIKVGRWRYIQRPHKMSCLLRPQVNNYGTSQPHTIQRRDMEMYKTDGKFHCQVLITQYHQCVMSSTLQELFGPDVGSFIFLVNVHSPSLPRLFLLQFCVFFFSQKHCKNLQKTSMDLLHPAGLCNI